MKTPLVYRHIGISVAVSLLISGFIFALLPRELKTSTQLLGYPVFDDFNINRNFYGFYLGGILFPILSCLAFHFLTRGREISWGWPVSSDLSAPQAFIFGKRIVQVLGLLVPLLPLAIYLLSSFSRITEGASVYRYPWASLGLCLAGTFLLAILAKKSFKKDRALGDNQSVATLVYCTFIPWLIFLTTAKLPGFSVVKDWYHYGESLATATMLQKGYVPYRDLIFVHGLWMDPLRSLLGIHIFGDSRWAREAIDAVLLMPLYFVFYFYLLNRLIPQRMYVAFVCLLPPLLLPSLFAHPQVRFLLLPILLLLFHEVLTRKNLIALAILGALAAFHFVLVPEGALVIVALGGVLCLRAVLFSPGQSLRSRSAPIIAFGGGSVLVLLAWMFVLHRYDALSWFFHYFKNFAFDHRFGSGVRGRDFKGPADMFCILWPVICLWIGCARLYGWWRTRRAPTPTDWTVLALILFTGAYYQKLLSRADHPHLYQSFAPSIPLLFYELWFFFRNRVSRMFERWRGFISREKQFGLGLLVLVGTLLPQLVSFPSRWQPHSEVSARGGRGIHTRFTNAQLAALSDFEILFASYLEPDERILDFTDEPELFFYHLDRESSTRYYTPIMAGTPLSQESIIEELKHNPPRMVIFQSSPNPNNPMDAVPHYVRHHLLSAFVLSEYVPFIKLDGHNVFRRKDVSWTAPSERGLTFQGELDEAPTYDIPPGCEWGYSLNFIHFEPGEHLRGRSLLMNPPDGEPEKQAHLSQVGTLDLSSLDVNKTEFVEVVFSSEADNFLSFSVDRIPKIERRISFLSKHKDGIQSIVIPVRSCPQWKGWRGEKRVMIYSLGPISIEKMMIYEHDREGGIDMSEKTIQEFVGRLSNLNDGGRWKNGISPTIGLPLTASKEEVLKKYFSVISYDPGKAKDYKILSSRKVTISDEEYEVVLVDTGIVGQRIIVLQAERLGWWAKEFGVDAFKKETK